MSKHFFLLCLLTCTAFAGEDYKLYKAGKKAWYSENWSVSADCFRKVIDDYPDSSFYVNSLYYAGSCLFKEKNYEACYDYLTRYLEIRGSDVSFQDAEDLRLKAAFYLARKQPYIKKVLLESLRGHDIDQALKSASLLMKLKEPSVIDELLSKLDQAHSPRAKQKIVDFISENGSVEDQARLKPYQKTSKPEIHIAKNKMIQLIVQKENAEVLNITVPISLIDYFKDFLSDDQITMIEKSEKKDLNNIIQMAREMKEGNVLLKVSSPDGDLIKIVVE
ncbi:MAG: hypothetical protein CSA81_03345 [Acidobacteria bacterium]|nr:MAG: hypothetical protein CSA81_03345 [Acidobacteriota bacterium]